METKDFTKLLLGLLLFGIFVAVGYNLNEKPKEKTIKLKIKGTTFGNSTDTVIIVKGFNSKYKHFVIKIE